MFKLCALFFSLLFCIQSFSQSIDVDFGQEGKIYAPLTDAVHQFEFGKLAVQKNGKIVSFINGYPLQSSSRRSLFFVARYNNNGSPDMQFGKEGFLDITSLLQLADDVVVTGRKILQQSDDKLLLVLRAGNDNLVIRVNKNGSIDSSYATNGVFILNAGEFVDIRDAGLQNTDKLILGGVPGIPWGVSYVYEYNFMTRITVDGRIDSTFAIDGVLRTLFYYRSGQESIIVLIVDPVTQAIFCSGESYEYWGETDGFAYVAKCTPDGTVDPSFPAFLGNGGNAYFNLPFGIDISPDHQFVCFGFKAVLENNDYHRDYVYQLRMDGSLDTAFRKQGRAEINWRTLCNTVKFGKDKKLYFSGDGKFDFLNSVVVARMNARGIRDEGFDGDGGFQIFGNGYTTSNNFDFHNRSGEDKGLVVSVIESTTSYIIRLHDIQQSMQQSSQSAIAVKDVPASVIYPNPVKSTLYINMNTTNIAKAQIIVTDVSGRQMIAQNINGAVTVHTVNVSNLKPGTYFITVTTGNTTVKSKFIKE
jgi:uncharacterized delta-60 repeat protein